MIFWCYCGFEHGNFVLFLQILLPILSNACNSCFSVGQFNLLARQILWQFILSAFNRFFSPEAMHDWWSHFSIFFILICMGKSRDCSNNSFWLFWLLGICKFRSQVVGFRSYCTGGVVFDVGQPTSASHPQVYCISSCVF